MRLSDATLADVQNADVPLYDRDFLNAGIVGLGAGNFLLGHMAYLTHQLLQRGEAHAREWGIVGVSLQSRDRSEWLNPQDGLYTVVEQNGNEDKRTVVGSVTRVIYAPEDRIGVIGKIGSPYTKIVAMAMTENGYYLKPDGSLDVDHEDIQHDLKAMLPKTALGFIAHGFAARELAGRNGFTVLSCDNIVHNGDYTRAAVLKFIELWKPALLPAAKEKLSFPNSMVDRIVPKTTDDLKKQTEDAMGVRDEAPVPAEPMPNIPWVIEDKFVAGRPPWEKVGARFTDDVTPYENMKLRLLNASHAAIASLGDMQGLTYIYETMQDPLLQAMMLRLMKTESEPTLEEVPNVDFSAYEKELVERFANTAVKDTVQRVATDAPLATLLNAIKDQLQTPSPQINLLSLAVAGWIYRMGSTHNELGRAVEIKHPRAAAIMEASRSIVHEPQPILAMKDVFGDVGSDPRVVDNVSMHFKSLKQVGVAMTVANALQAGPR